MLLAFLCLKDFILYQIDVKSTFLNVYIMEEIYVKQLLDFKNKKIFKLYVQDF